MCVHCIYIEHRNVMSTSSVGSTASVGFQGGASGLEPALDHTCRDLINHMNHVQLALRNLAAAPEQDLEYQEELDICGRMDDNLREMCWLFDDLRGYQCDLLSEPSTAEEKSQLKVWKVQRKELEKKLQAEHAAQAKEDRAASKLALKLEKSRIAGAGDVEMKAS